LHIRERDSPLPLSRLYGSQQSSDILEAIEAEMSSQEVRIRTDTEVLVGALEEAQRLLAAYENPCCNRTRDDIIAMVEFIICNPSVTRAMLHQKTRSRLKLVG
jgi:hypothetical protein